MQKIMLEFTFDMKFQAQIIIILKYFSNITTKDLPYLLKSERKTFLEL